LKKVELSEKMLNIQKVDDGVVFRIKVQPGAVKNESVGVQRDVLKIKISAPPVKGKANKALIDFLAKKLSVKKSEIEIVSGHTSKIKKIKMLGEASKIKEKIQSLAIFNP
jgi:uncharacterized protein (TIGR00251 family)